MNDLISRQAAINALDVLCQEHRYKIPGEWGIYSQYNEAWQDALDRAENAIFRLLPAQPEIIRCKDCKHRQLIDEDRKEAGYYCELDSIDPYEWTRKAHKDDWFCADAERRTDG